MSGPPPPHRPPGHETTALVVQVVDELAGRLAQDIAGPPAGRADPVGDPRRHALERLRVLAGVKEAVRHLEDQAARTAAANGAGYPEIGEAVGISRQGARRRWPGLTAHPAHGTTPDTHPGARESWPPPQSAPTTSC
ncbi:hypothetical protein [Streptomyces asoensis]|uniref:hypothetical protein n=1 Tax=Streptomyces asoensis TaxID=249586 RepID=UPI00167A737B|nr:hypothetical protein [Streptomyces asoensis]